MNKNRTSSTEQFVKDMQSLFADYYHKQLSENIKRGLQAKKAGSAKKS